MSNLVSHAKFELDLAGITADSQDEINREMRENILEIVQTFADQGHSGASAIYALGILNKLLNFTPLSPLTGEDAEWVEVSDGLWKNKRCFHVFKDNTGPYDSTGIVFWDWDESANDGSATKIYFTDNESIVPITFPYMPTTEYKHRLISYE